MPARDILHDIVKQALIKEGWTITHDPFTVFFGVRKIFADLAAEQLIAAEKDSRRIAVEIKSFIGRSPVADLEQAIGQYVVYRSWLTRTKPERKLYLAITETAFDELFRDISGQVLLEDHLINLIVVDEKRMEIVRWTD
jgi:hypothetical protein